MRIKVHFKPIDIKLVYHVKESEDIKGLLKRMELDLDLKLEHLELADEFRLLPSGLAKNLLREDDLVTAGILLFLTPSRFACKWEKESQIAIYQQRKRRRG
jgi:hypothetical protein